jgi:DNA polymerase/3'-5' exonuclease PolX
LELEGQPEYKIWSYRKAAWAIEDLEQDIGLVYRTMGIKGLESIPNVGSSLGRVVEGLLK